MTRFAIYARYSSNRQSETSVEDQVRLCRERVENEGGEIAGIYEDHRISGSHRINLPAMNRMMQDAKLGKFDVIMAESLDRLSRDQEDTAGFHKRMKFVDVGIFTLYEGKITELQIGFKGTMNALALQDIADKTRRGQRGRVEKGAIPGGLTYGYRIVRELDAKGEPVRGLRAIDEAQAAVVRRIFAEYISGKSGRAIAAGLNAAGIPSPRGGGWKASTINGNKSRRNGMLNNELYGGRIVYNRQRFIKDPETGRRTARPNPEKNWILKHVPELQLIDDATWQAAQNVKKRFEHLSLPRARRPKHTFSGLIKCPDCGANFIAIGREKIGCGNHKEAGVCANGRTVAIAAIEDIVIDGLKKNLCDPDIMREYVTEYHAEVRRLRKEKQGDRIVIERKLAEVTRQIEGIIKAITDGMYHASMKVKMTALEAEKSRMEGELEAMGEEGNVIDLQPNMTESYIRRVEVLHAALRQEDSRQEAMTFFRSMVDKIIPHAPEHRQGGSWAVDIVGNLANLLIFVAQINKTPAGSSRTGRGTVVAGAGFGLNPASSGSTYLIEKHRKMAA